MSVMRNRPKGARFASFGLGLCVFALMPTEIGYQDIASLLARQPGVAERWQKRVFSAASTIQVATYSFGRPIGTSSPQTATYRLASLDNQGIDITGSVTRNPLVAGAAALSGRRFPQGRPHAEGRSPRHRDARACAAARGEPRPRSEDPSTSNASVKGAKTADAAPAAEHRAARSGTGGSAERAAAAALRCLDVARSPAARRLEGPVRRRGRRLAPAPPRDGFSFKTSSLFFGSSSLGSRREHGALAARRRAR